MVAILPSVSEVARRLSFCAWPVLLLLELPANLPTSAEGFARFRCPDHPLFDVVLPAVDGLGPVLVVDTGDSTTDGAIERLGSVVGLAVNAGELPLGRTRRWCGRTRAGGE